MELFTAVEFNKCFNNKGRKKRKERKPHTFPEI
jgi:hypothetical protein